MFKKIAGFFHRHPGIKSTAITAAGAAVTLGAQGAFGPQAAVVAGAVSALAGLWIKRPKDATPEDKNPPAPMPDLSKLTPEQIAALLAAIEAAKQR